MDGEAVNGEAVMERQGMKNKREWDYNMTDF